MTEEKSWFEQRTGHTIDEVMKDSVLYRAHRKDVYEAHRRQVSADEEARLAARDAETAARATERVGKWIAEGRIRVHQADKRGS